MNDSRLGVNDIRLRLQAVFLLIILISLLPAAKGEVFKYLFRETKHRKPKCLCCNKRCLRSRNVRHCNFFKFIFSLCERPHSWEWDKEGWTVEPLASFQEETESCWLKIETRSHLSQGLRGHESREQKLHCWLLTPNWDNSYSTHVMNLKDHTFIVIKLWMFAGEHGT